MYILTYTCTHYRGTTPPSAQVSLRDLMAAEEEKCFELNQSKKNQSTIPPLTSPPPQTAPPVVQRSFSYEDTTRYI